MGRKREREESSSEHGSSKKKHKKNKHSHKSKHKEKPHPITLKIKLGDKLMSTTSTGTRGGDGTFVDEVSSVAESEPLSLTEQSVGVEEEWEGSDISVGKDEFEVGSNPCVGDEDEEEAWLDALESGEVDERGYIPNKKKTSTLTARQRALLGGEDSESLLELPLSKKETATEEDLLKKMEKNQKRRLAAQRRKEKRKAETVRKLIEKQATKKKDDEPKTFVKQTTPHIRYITSTRPLELTADETLTDRPSAHTLLSLPVGMEYPITQQLYSSPSSPTLCAIEECGQVKKYSDSLTHLPLCSLQCYKKLRARDKSDQSIATLH